MEDAAIVWERAVLAKHPLSLPIRFISITDFSYHPEDSLRGEREQVLDAEIESFLNGILVEGTVLPGPVADEVSSIIGALKYEEKGCLLPRGRTEFDLDGQFHGPSIS